MPQHPILTDPGLHDNVLGPMACVVSHLNEKLRASLSSWFAQYVLFLGRDRERERGDARETRERCERVVRLASGCGIWFLLMRLHRLPEKPFSILLKSFQSLISYRVLMGPYSVHRDKYICAGTRSIAVLCAAAIQLSSMSYVDTESQIMHGS